MNDTTYATMLIGDYNSTEYMDRIENDASAWSPDRAAQIARRDAAIAAGARGVVVVQRTVAFADDIRFSIV